MTIRQITECNVCKKEIAKGASHVEIHLHNVPRIIPSRASHIHEECFPLWAGEYFLGRLEKVYPANGGDKMTEPQVPASSEDTQPAENAAESAESSADAETAEESEESAA